MLAPALGDHSALGQPSRGADRSLPKSDSGLNGRLPGRKAQVTEYCIFFVNSLTLTENWQFPCQQHWSPEAFVSKASAAQPGCAMFLQQESHGRMDRWTDGRGDTFPSGAQGLQASHLPRDPGCLPGALKEVASARLLPLEVTLFERKKCFADK